MTITVGERHFSEKLSLKSDSEVLAALSNLTQLRLTVQFIMKRLSSPPNQLKLLEKEIDHWTLRTTKSVFGCGPSESDTDSSAKAAGDTKMPKADATVGAFRQEPPTAATSKPEDGVCFQASIYTGDCEKICSIFVLLELVWSLAREKEA